MPARVQIEARIVHARRADDAPEPLARTCRTALALARGEGAAQDAQAHALAAPRARRAEIHRAEAPPSALEEPVELRRRHVEHHLHFEPRLLRGQVRTLVRLLDDVFQELHRGPGASIMLGSRAPVSTPASE